MRFCPRGAKGLCSESKKVLKYRRSARENGPGPVVLGSVDAPEWRHISDRRGAIVGPFLHQADAPLIKIGSRVGSFGLVALDMCQGLLADHVGIGISG